MTMSQPAKWPTATLDPVRRLRVLAATLPGVHLEERDVEVPFEQLWEFLTDLEHNVPRFDTLVTKLRVTHRSAERLRVVATTSQHLSIRLDVDLEPGFMWMQAPGRAYVVGIGAAARGSGGSRYAHLEGIPNRVGQRLQHRTTRHVQADVENLVRLLDRDV
jgi:hypothetical protein